MPLGDKLGRPFEMLSLIGRKRKDEPDDGHRLSGAEARAYANATGAATSGYTHSHSSHSHHHASSSSSSSSFYPAVKYERITPAAQPAPVVQYERLTPGSAAASSTPAAPSVTLPSPMDYEAAAREAAFPSPDLVPSAAVASSSFRSAPSPALSSLPSPGMLTPLTPAVGATPTPVGRSPAIDTIRPLRPPRSTQAQAQGQNLASPAQPPVGPTAVPSAPFSSVMEEWMSQLRTPTPDVTLLPSPYDFNKDTPTPMDTNSMDMRRLQDALLPTPPPDVHDQRQHPKNSAGQMETKYTTLPARPLRAREESISSAYSDDGESQAKVLAAAAALSSVSSMGVASTPTASSGTKGKRRKMCTAEGCQNLSRSRGLCKAHGGGRRCSVEGCSRASQSGSLCITHGGGKRCTVDGCVKAAQSRGMCKAHGGGVRCRVEGCSKSSQGDGFCRSHGGGRRCGHPSGCSKWAQRNGMCMAHSEGKYGNSYRGRQHRMEQQEPVVQQT
ncbi:WRKY transcription factor 19 [Phytophthora cinnamomi]|uniref:WRKY transcription factor 19 n=1 Tax=Phytophthora cinnamomi TaxID=4785 RepID=UPI00355A0AC8|nr:WRKY transcription factor 19 [Phytophthora cinnamomi]